MPPRMCSWNPADGLQACDLLSLLQGFLQVPHIFTQFCYYSVAKSRLTFCNPMVCGSLGSPVLHCHPEFAQTHVRWASDVIQPSHPLFPPSPLALNLSQHQGLFKWDGSLHQVAKVLELQLQHQSFNENSGLTSFRIDWLDLLAVQGTVKSLLLERKLTIHRLKWAFPNSRKDGYLCVCTWLHKKP